MRFKLFNGCALLLSALVLSADTVTSGTAPSQKRPSSNVRKSISDFDLSSARPVKGGEDATGALLPNLGANPARRRSVGSALSPEEGIGKGASVDLTWDDAQYQEGQGRHVAHWWNGEYGVSAEVSVHFGYRDMPDSSQISSPRYSGYNVYEAVSGFWPRTQDLGCALQSTDTAGWGGMLSLDIMSNGRAVSAAASHFGNGFLGDGSPLVDNMVFYQDPEFGCSYAPGVNTTFIDSLVYRPHFLDQSEGIYSRNPQVVTQWDGSNTIVHLLLLEDSEGVPLTGYDYSEQVDYATVTYYRKVGSTATTGSWSAGHVIDSIWFPWVAMDAAPYPHEGVAVTYTNPSYYGALLNVNFDFDVYMRESLDRGLTWEVSRDISYLHCGILPCDPPAYVNWLESQPLYSSDGDLHVIMTGTPTSADPYFDGFDWDTWNADIYHWAKSWEHGMGNTLVKVANGTFPDYNCGSLCWFSMNHCGFGSPNAGYIANINISECDQKLYCVWNQIHERANRMPWIDAPASGVLDDCAHEGNRVGIANWEILMSVARLETNWLWDLARNVSDTYTPNCGLADDPEAEGPCASEYKPSVERYGFDQSGLTLTWPVEAAIDLSPGQDYAGTSYLNLQYLDDQFPGTSMWSSRRTEPRTLNSIKWIRLACVEPVEASAISVQPPEFQWPLWAELGQSINLTVTIINTGNVMMHVTEIGFVEASGGGWLSTSINPTPSSPFQVPAGGGWYNEETFDIIVDASGIAATTWLEGEVWLKSDAINEDSTSIKIHLLAAPEVESVVWDTVQSHQNMFDIYFPTDGECVALAVGNNGEVGWGAGTSGRVNLDYVESETQCGDRSADAIYLRSGSAFTMLADDASGANAELTCSYMDPN